MIAPVLTAQLKAVDGVVNDTEKALKLISDDMLSVLR